MIKSNKLIEKVQEYYSTIKSNNLEIELTNKNVLLQNEKYLDNENNIGKARFNLAKYSYENNLEKIEYFSNLLENLEKIKKNILAENKHLIKETKYNCPSCKDTGYLKNKRCKCFNNLLTKYAFEALEVPKHEDFVFSNIVPEKLKKHYEKMQEYIDKFPNTMVKNFVFSGPTGTGKTYLSKFIENEINKKNYSTIFLSATDLINIFLKIHLGEVDRELIFDILVDCDLLIIDDLSTEPMYKNVTIEYLLTLISLKLDRNKPFIITTNLLASEILERYNERFLSRLSDKTKTIFVPFNFEDLRKSK